MRRLTKRAWDRLTLFLRQAGAPLDNNIAERGLKKAILHRKNSMFYRTQNGANPFEYLTALQRYSAEVARNPSGWMPWNYREMLRRTSADRDSGEATLSGV